MRFLANLNLSFGFGACLNLRGEEPNRGRPSYMPWWGGIGKGGQDAQSQKRDADMSVRGQPVRGNMLVFGQCVRCNMSVTC